MVANNSKNESVQQPMFTIENNILKGKVMVYDNRYTSVGKLLFDCLKGAPDFVSQMDAITGIEQTSADVLDRAIKCALWLQKLGVEKGDIVAISSHNHLDCIVPYIATLFLGAIFNAWNSEMNVQLARHFITLSQPKVIFANEKLTEVVLEAAKIENFHIEVVTFGDHPHTISFPDVLKGHEKSAVDNFRCKELDDSEHTAIICFSSGTTGLPKGVQISHKAMLLELLGLDEGFCLNRYIGLWYSSLAWISGAILSLKAIASYTKKIVGSDFEEKATCEIIEKFKVTYLTLSTSMANRFIRYNGLHNYDLSSLKWLFIGGASLQAVSQDLLKKHLPHATIIQAYGMTELGSVIARQLPDSTSGSCGWVDANCEIKIVNTETGRTLGANQSGELYAKSLKIMTGYYKNPEATSNIIDKDGWLHTGDLAYYNDKGELFVIDRLKELIKYRSHHVMPRDIEDLLQSHPAVLEAAVVSVPHPTDDEHPIAFVSKVPNKEVSAEELIKMVEINMMDHCRLRGGVKFLPSLPHTHSGKVSRKDLKAMAKKLAVY